MFPAPQKQNQTRKTYWWQPFTCKSRDYCIKQRGFLLLVLVGKSSAVTVIFCQRWFRWTVLLFLLSHFHDGNLKQQPYLWIFILWNTQRKVQRMAQWVRLVFPKAVRITKKSIEHKHQSDSVAHCSRPTGSMLSIMTW